MHAIDPDAERARIFLNGKRKKKSLPLGDANTRHKKDQNVKFRIDKGGGVGGC